MKWHFGKLFPAIVHFTVVCLVTLPLSGSKVGGDLALIQTFSLSYVNNAFFDAN